MKIRKNDNVIVIAGNDSGKTGKVLKVFPKDSKIIIEGINLRKRHTKPNQKNPQGGIIEKEAPIHASNVILLHFEKYTAISSAEYGIKPCDVC